MISKMKFFSLIAPREEFDRIVSTYIIHREVQFENPLFSLKNTEGFTMDASQNPYEDVLAKLGENLERAGVDIGKIKPCKGNLSPEEVDNFLERFNQRFLALQEEIGRLETELQTDRETVRILEPIVKAHIQLDQLAELQYLNYRFGKMPLVSHKKLITYLKNLPAYFYALSANKNDVWGIYFASDADCERVDRIFSTLYFEPVKLDENQKGTPAQIIESIEKRTEANREKLAEKEAELKDVLAEQQEELLRVYANVKFMFELYRIRHFSAVSPSSFCLTGWTDSADARQIAFEMEKETECSVILEKPDAVPDLVPPTKLKNWVIFKPFEEFVRMYGVPNYHELDPTPIFAVVYTLLFGIMFGDVGHGLCLLGIGILMTLLKKGGFLGKLLVPIGVSSAFFGLIYGSVFGFESEHAILKPLWYTPFENSTTMMNTLIYSVILGVVIIFLCMALNIANGIRQKNWQKVFFSQNGLAGILFYGLVLYCALAALVYSKKPFALAGIFIAISLVLIFLQKPLGALLAKKKDWMPKEKGGFFVEAFFELFEIVLSFVTNTVSFLRVGAFALNHAGMMSVVVMFMLQMQKTGSVAIAIFGNLLVIGLEGLIVGIQVLRLGFYEMFSRFYDGNGKEFHPTVKMK